MYIISKFKNKCLCITSSSILISFFYSLFYSNTNILSFLLLSTYYFSQLFWSNPIQYSLIHKIDSVIAKTSISYFIIYTLTYKELTYLLYYSYLFIILNIFIMSYLSNIESTKKWCSDKHILYHGLLHIFCFIGSFYAFF
jgi:hypothetical protein